MAILSQSAFLQVLAWCLLNSIWQFAGLWLIYLLITRLYTTASPELKHNLALGLVSAGSVIGLVGFLQKYLEDDHLPFSFTISPSSAYAVAYEKAQHIMQTAMPYVSIAYLLVIGIMLVRFAFAFRSIRILQTKNLIKIAPAYKLYVAELAMRMSIGKKVSVWLSENINAPVMIGYFKPMILLPVAAVNQLSTEQLEAILLHEMAHIQRNDYLANVLISVVGILLFFNPFARLLIRTIENEREKICDDQVLQFSFSPQNYAAALLQLEKNRLSHVSLALSSNGNDKKILLQRVKRIIGLPDDQSANRKQVLIPASALLLASFIFVQPANTVRSFTPVAPVESYFYASFKPVGYKGKKQDEIVFTLASNNNTTPTSVRSKETTCTENKVKDNQATNLAALQKIRVSANAISSEVADEDESADEQGTPVQMVTNVDIQPRDYVIPENAVKINIQPTAPDAPYVPQVSFEYHSIQDSVSQRTINERERNVAMLRATTALDMARQMNIDKKNKLIANLQKSVVQQNFYEKQKATELINMQANALMQLVIASTEKQRAKAMEHTFKIDSLEKQIRLVRKSAIISL